ncbi:MAG: hypothetical protein OJF60_001505 [Burkholderiaceae bacterium]|nr:MAG: hypothetical protein OJF60_001505 [Burkholderiaceae bacterium]
MADPPDAASATVSRSVAVWVAAITALGGFATAIATGAFGLIGKSKPTPVVQHWLRIESVELPKDGSLPQIDRVRLVAQVNGVSYGFPTSVYSVWAPVGPGMTAERYPLPIGAASYRVKFYGFGLTADARIPRYEYRGTAEYAVRRLPIAGETQTLQYTTSGPAGLSAGMIVRYSIE